MRTFNDGYGAQSAPYKLIVSATFPSPGRGECGGRRDRDEGSAGGSRPYYFPCEICRRSSSFSNAIPTWAVASSRMSMSSIGFSLSPLSV